MVKDYITDRNVSPSVLCPICLNGFEEKSSAIFSTFCDHDIHSYCFFKYVDYCRRDIARQLKDWPVDMGHKVDQVKNFNNFNPRFSVIFCSFLQLQFFTIF